MVPVHDKFEFFCCETRKFLEIGEIIFDQRSFQRFHWWRRFGFQVTLAAPRWGIAVSVETVKQAFAEIVWLADDLVDFLCFVEGWGGIWWFKLLIFAGRFKIVGLAGKGFVVLRWIAYHALAGVNVISTKKNCGNEKNFRLFQSI